MALRVGDLRSYDHDVRSRQRIIDPAKTVQRFGETKNQWSWNFVPTMGEVVQQYSVFLFTSLREFPKSWFDPGSFVRHTDNWLKMDRTVVPRISNHLYRLGSPGHNPRVSVKMVTYTERVWITPLIKMTLSV